MTPQQESKKQQQQQQQPYKSKFLNSFNRGFKQRDRVEIFATTISYLAHCIYYDGDRLVGSTLRRITNDLFKQNNRVTKNYLAVMYNFGLIEILPLSKLNTKIEYVPTKKGLKYLEIAIKLINMSKLNQEHPDFNIAVGAIESCQVLLDMEYNNKEDILNKAKNFNL